tara:strand:- start:2403 stop:3104 length:702 start_codon:yes stop_codon:yes gene_type:complete
MAGAITITSFDTFKNQSGVLSLVDPSTTARPVGHWSIPRWWGSYNSVVYEHCVRIDNSSTSESIYISSSEEHPHLKVEYNGSQYVFDGDYSRKHINRILVTTDATFQTGSDYRVPLKGQILKVTAGNTGTVYYTVTVQNVSGSNKYFLNGVQQPTITLTLGQSVNFTQSDSSNSGHPIAIYTDASKTTQITSGVVSSGTAGSSGQTTYTPASTGTFSYQCSAHAAMGGVINVV